MGDEKGYDLVGAPRRRRTPGERLLLWGLAAAFAAELLAVALLNGLV